MSEDTEKPAGWGNPPKGAKGKRPKKEKTRTQKETMQQRGGRYTAQRRATRKKVQEEIAAGATLVREDPPLMDPMDLMLHLHPNDSYRPEYDAMAAEMAALGGTDIEIARALGRSLSTIWGWQSRHESFFRACILGKDLPKKRVEKAMYARAVGYTYPELDIRVVNGTIVATPILKHLPPDVTAGFRYLEAHDRETYGREAKLNLSSDESFTALWQMVSTGQTIPLQGMAPAADEGSE